MKLSVSLETQCYTTSIALYYEYSSSMTSTDPGNPGFEKKKAVESSDVIVDDIRLLQCCHIRKNYFFDHGVTTFT
jgi:hypothetical protein